MKPYQIGIDLGGTKTEAILFNPDGEELHRQRIPTPRERTENYHAILHAVHGLIRETLNRIGRAEDCTIGIGIPGTLSRETQRVQNANTTSLIGKPFKADIEKLLGRKVGMENDANCFTLAESRSGSARGYHTVLGIIMGTGCGGGICIDGKIQQGKHGIAGEWGHFSVDPAGAECFCGNRGCIETKISGTGVENAFYEKFKKRFSMHEIVQGFRQGDSRCTGVFHQFLDDFGRCLGGLISIVDPDVIVIGGGLSNINELYSLGIDRIRRHSFHPHIETSILQNKLGDSAGVYGAAWIGTI